MGSNKSQKDQFRRACIGTNRGAKITQLSCNWWIRDRRPTRHDPCINAPTVQVPTIAFTSDSHPGRAYATSFTPTTLSIASFARWMFVTSCTLMRSVPAFS